MTYTEQIKSILEKSGVDTSALPDNLYSTLLNALLNAEMGGGGLTREDVEKIVTDEVAKIVADAPEDFDTLKEMSDWISQHENSAAAMNSSIQQNTTDISTLKNDSHTHTNKTVLDGITQVQLDKITTNETNISTLAKHINGDLLDSDFQEDSTVAMTKTVPSGMSNYAAVKMIGGKTQKFNQLALTEGHYTFPNSVNNITMSENNGNISIIANNSTAVTYIQLSGITSVIGHVYYVKNGNGYTSDTNIFVYNDYGGISTQNRSKIIGIANKEKSFYIRIDAGVIANVTIRPQIFDLTAMFGAGNEPTMEEFDAMFPEEYYEPTMGELWNTPVESVVSTSADGTTKITLLIPEVIKNLPDYGCAVSDTVYNYVDFENMVYHHVVGSVDMGDLNYLAWEGAGLDGARLFVNSHSPLTDKKAGLSNIICAPYTTSIVGYVKMDNGYIVSRYETVSAPYIYIRDDTKSSNVTDFKNGLKGQKLLYELATEELIDISDILHPIRVETGGTITFNNEHSLDVPNTVLYKKEVSL